MKLSVFLFFCTLGTISIGQTQENNSTEKNMPDSSVNVSKQEPVPNSKKISKRVIKPVVTPINSDKEKKKTL